MALRSTRFAGDPILEGCLNGTARLTPGTKGPAVVKIQQALLDLGEKLPRFGADGSFGSEMTAAVISFQKKKKLSPADGIVGSRTMGELDEAFAADKGGFSVTPAGTHWGVDTAAPANAVVRNRSGQLTTLFDLVLGELGMPEFWGRYLFGSKNLGVTALSKAEADFIFDTSSGLCRILPIDNIAAARFSQGIQVGRQDAQAAVSRCGIIGVKSGVMVYADIEPQFKCSAGWFQGWWEVMQTTGRGGGGLYVDPSQFPFSTPHRAALKATLNPVFKAINPNPEFFLPDPPGAARLLWSQRPVRFFKTPINKANFKPAEYAPLQPTYQKGMTAIWQYAGNCPVIAGSPTVIDMNLANDQGFARMWIA